MPAPLFSKNAHRYDPYRTFKFRVSIDGQAVAGLRKMSGLKKTIESTPWTTAGDSTERKLPGGVTYEPITLEQGLTHDPVFEQWANLVNSPEGDGGMSLKGFRKTITIDVLNLQGQIAMTYSVLGAWVSEYQALPEFDAGTTNTIGIQTIKLEHDGWVRDIVVEEPAET